MSDNTELKPEEIASLLRRLTYRPQPPKEFPGNRVFLGIFSKGVYQDKKDEPSGWKTRKIESEFGPDHYVVSVKRWEDDEYRDQIRLGIEPKNDSYVESETEPVVQTSEPIPEPHPEPPIVISSPQEELLSERKEEPIVGVEKTPKPRVRKPKKPKFEVSPVHNVTINTLQKDIVVNISEELSTYRPGVQDSEMKIPSGSHDMVLVNAYAGIKDLGKWIGFFKDEVFYGRTITSWKMVKEGYYGEVDLKIEGFDL